MKIQLDGQRALITGGTSGIGRAIALAFKAAGAEVAVNGRSSLAGEKDGLLMIPADVSEASEVERMFRTLDEAWSGMDILVNCAGIDGARSVSWESDPAAWKKVMDVNVFGTFLCSREALKRMIPKKKGVVLNISSVHEVIPWSGYSAYAASKAAVGMLTRTLSQEAAPHGIRVVALGPGAVRTPINRSVWSSPEGLKDLQQKIPLGRIAEPEEMARMALVLVSDAASYLTGQTVFVDGGMTDYPGFAHGG